MAALTPEPRMASVTAIEDSKLLRLNQRALNDLIDSDSAIARGIIQELAGFVRKRTADLVELRKQLDESASDHTARSRSQTLLVNHKIRKR